MTKDSKSKGEPKEAAEPEAPRALKKGREAVAQMSVALKVEGVAVQQMADMHRGKAGEKSQFEGTETFDPATDLPMFRDGMNWFVLRVASNKENSVQRTLLRKVQIEGIEHWVGRIMVPTEKVKSMKAGKPRITETKLYPGYVFVEMRLENDGRINQDVFFLIKETDGVGDFVGTSGKPAPMAQHEVEKMLFDSKKPEEAPQVKMEFAKGDKVTINEGAFQNYEGEVDEVLPDKGLVRVLVTIFGRQAPIELEYWQVRKGIEELP